jgi:hypothetical protein
MILQFQEIFNNLASSETFANSLYFALDKFCLGNKVLQIKLSSMIAQLQLMKNNLEDSRDVITISTSCMSTIISTLEFKNKNLRHHLIMAKREIGELMTCEREPSQKYKT